MIKSSILLTLVFLVGCSSFQIENAKTVRVVEYGSTGGAGVSLVRGDGQIGGCKVQTSDMPIEGNLIMTYDGEKCDVEYSRGY